MRTDEKAFVERLRTLTDDPDALRATLEGVRPEDVAEAFPRLERDEMLRVLQLLEPETAAYVLVELPTETARMLVNELPDTTLAHYLDVLPMDDAVELREELDPERFEALLRVIPNEDAQEIRRLMSYPEDSAGQLMTEDFVEVSPDMTMEGVIDVVRHTDPEEFETVNTIYVLSEDRHLLGVLTLRRVLRANPYSTARDVMNDDPISVPVTMPQEELARTLARYGFSAMPVLDDRGRMVGIVTADDAAEVLEEADTEDVLKMGGVSGDAEAYLSLGVWSLVKRRVPWLLILFVAEFFTGSVLRHYVPEQKGNASDLAVLAKLQWFVPLLIGAGGNAGAQVTTTITRALALGEIRSPDWLRVMRRELIVAMIVGGFLGSIGFLRAWLPVPVIGWQQPVNMALVVGFALPAIVVWAATVGSMLPIAAKRLGFDPAVMSAPFITTFVDATGLIIFFEIAFRILGLHPS
ncbi:magnesium transporter [bacterium]|nr:MAG: magnesium transporter [bacterium]